MGHLHLLAGTLAAVSPSATGVLVQVETPVSIVQFVPADGGPPVRIAPETGRGYGRRGGRVDIFDVHPATGTVLLTWTAQETLFRDLFAVRADGRDAAAPRLLVSGVSIYATPAFSPDGRHVVIATREAIVRVAVDGGPPSVLSRLPAPVNSSESLLEAPPLTLTWTLGGAEVELPAFRGRPPGKRLVPWDSAAVALDALPTTPSPAPQDTRGGTHRFVPGSTTLAFDGPWEAKTIHPLRLDGSLGPALGPALAGQVVSAPEVGRVVVHRDGAVVSFVVEDDELGDERVLIPAASRDSSFFVVPGESPRVVAHRLGDGALVSVPVTGGPTQRLAADFDPASARMVSGGFVVARQETRSELNVANGAEPARPVAKGSVTIDDWTPDHRQYVWATSGDADAGSARLVGLTAGGHAPRTLAAGLAAPAGFAAGWLLVDRSPSAPPEMVRLDADSPDARPTGLGSGFVVLRGRADPPGWVAMSRTGELWAVPVAARGPGPAKRVTQGLEPSFGFELAGDCAVALRTDSDGRMRVVAVPTAERNAGAESTLFGPASGAGFSLYGEPADGQMLLTVPSRKPPAVSEAMVLMLGAEPRVQPLPDGLLPHMDPGASTLASDAGGQRLLARSAVGDLYALTWGQRPRRLLPASPRGVVSPPPSSDEDVMAPVPVAWPAIGPTGQSLIARGTELWQVDVSSDRAPVRIGGTPPASGESNGAAVWAWSPDGQWVAGAARNRVSFLGRGGRDVVDVALDAEISEARVVGWRLTPAAALVVAVASSETRLIAVPPPGGGTPVVLLASSDGVPRVAGVFGPGNPWLGRRARSRSYFSWQ